jgi:phosphate starvation-inducible PhoH-like protein
VTIFRRGDRFVVTGTNAERAVEVLERFYEKADRPVAVDDIQLALVEQRANAAADEEAGLPPLPARRGKPLRLPPRCRQLPPTTRTARTRCPRAPS